MYNNGDTLSKTLKWTVGIAVGLIVVSFILGYIF